MKAKTFILMVVITTICTYLWLVNDKKITNTDIVRDTDTVYVMKEINDTVYVKGKTKYITNTVVDTLTKVVYVYRDVESETFSLYNNESYSDSLYVKYNSIVDTFIINRNIKVKEKIINNTITITVKEPINPFHLVGNIGIWNDKDSYPLSIGAGIRFNKYYLLGNIKTDHQYGIQIGMEY